MQITGLEPQKKNPDRVNVHVDGQFRIALAAEIAWAEHLHVGDDVTDEQLAELEARDHAWKAREAVLVLLSFRPRTAAELRRRLVEKGYPAEVAETCVASLGDHGLVNDASFAEVFVRDRVRLRPKGRRVLAQELRMKGVDAETADTVIDDVMERESSSDTDLARAAAAKWRPRAGEDAQRARRRLHGFLARRGFTGDAVRTVMDEVMDRDVGDSDEEFDDAE
ncbi:MAG TPA: regulatory protein RecX [Longimicrobiaceae bacterium]|jgi:regulatory protein|nr:regulatory protein RecX [Longimicrobiaceae bacterium]